MRCPIESGEGRLLLDPTRPALLEEHIRECSACGEFSAAMASVDAALDLWEAPPVSPDFDQRLYSRIARDVPWWETLVSPLRASFAWGRVALAAACVLLVAAGLWIERPGALPPPAAQTRTVEPLPAEQAEHALQEMETMQELSRLVAADPAGPRI